MRPGPGQGLTRPIWFLQSRRMSSDAPQGYYAASARPAAFGEPLRHDVHADVCVVGAGYTGLSAALHLALSGVNVALVEAETVGFAASGRNGGQIHPGHRKDQKELERWLGKQHARDLWSLSEEARHLVFKLAAEDCDLRHGLIIAAHNKRTAQALAAESEFLAENYGYGEIEMLDHARVTAALGTDVYPAARLDQGGGHLHPLKFARRLASMAVAAGASIFEHSPAVRLDGPHTVVCAHGKVVAHRVILACDAFTAKLAPQLGPFIAHVESFIVAAAPLEAELAQQIIPSDVAVADTRHVLDYYRKSADWRLLFAGREAYWTPPNDVIGLVRPRMLKVFPQLKNISIEFGWSGTVGITRTRMPHFGKIGERAFFAHGYSGHGVALATLGGKVLAQAVLGDTERFDALARVPAQKFPGGALLRRPMVTAALLALKICDAF
jgi:gamma-glutamylputrescine oxidase